MSTDKYIALFHGTSQKCYEAILAEGKMKARTYLTLSDKVADYYADCQAEDDESVPVVLLIKVSVKHLRADYPSFREPLSFIKEGHGVDSDEEWHDALFLDIAYPETEFDYLTSLESVACAMYEGEIAAIDILSVSKNACIQSFEAAQKALTHL
ncbi:hypothetical protein ACI2KR_26895 [Pseudomonas luteola]